MLSRGQITQKAISHGGKERNVAAGRQLSQNLHLMTAAKQQIVFFYDAQSSTSSGAWLVKMSGECVNLQRR